MPRILINVSTKNLMGGIMVILFMFGIVMQEQQKIKLGIFGLSK
jgi:hypothetical protein